MGHRIQFDRYPGGVMKALTLSYDDGVVHDRRLVEICNRYGLRGTFNLNSGTLGNPGRIEAGKSLNCMRGMKWPFTRLLTLRCLMFRTNS